MDRATHIRRFDELMASLNRRQRELDEEESVAIANATSESEKSRIYESIAHQRQLAIDLYDREVTDLQSQVDDGI